MHAGVLQPDDENIMYPELEVKPVTAGSIKLHGHIDYAVAKSATKNVGARKAALAQGSDLPSNVFLTALEAKKDESFAAGMIKTIFFNLLHLQNVIGTKCKRCWANHGRDEGFMGIE
jgi:hypothetical protein